jgi:hypothetical protein
MVTVSTVFAFDSTVKPLKRFRVERSTRATHLKVGVLEFGHSCVKYQHKERGF